MYAMQYSKQESATPVVITVVVHLAIVFGLAKGLGANTAFFTEKEPFEVIMVPQQIEPPPVEVPRDASPVTSGVYVAPAEPSFVIDQGPIVIATNVPVIDVDPGTGGGIFIDEAIVNARILQSSEPPYPAVSRMRDEEGIVLVKIMITPYGTAGDVQVEKSSGYSRLDEAAVKAVRGWKFAPAKRGAQAIATWVTVPVKFVLNGKQ